MALQGFHSFPSPAWNWWTVGNLIPASSCIAAWQPKGAASLTDSYINLANPGCPPVIEVAPTFDPFIGWTFNGSTQYLLARFYTRALMSYCVRISNCATNAASRNAFGGQNNGDPYDGVCFQNTSASDVHYYANGLGLSVAGRVTEGTFAATPTKAFRNGVADGVINNTMAHPHVIIAIGAVMMGGAISQYLNGNIIALSFYSTPLTDAQAIALSNAVALL